MKVSVEKLQFDLGGNMNGRRIRSRLHKEFTHQVQRPTSLLFPFESVPFPIPVKVKISGWTGKLLSFAGRFKLIKWVLHAYQMYWLAAVFSSGDRKDDDCGMVPIRSKVI